MGTGNRRKGTSTSITHLMSWNVSATPSRSLDTVVTVGMITAVIRLIEWARVIARWSKLGKTFVVGLLPLIGDRLTS